jgi:PHD/YefM family antitoxin component YafN of YafNO toxin-antitoxin module
MYIISEDYFGMFMSTAYWRTTIAAAATATTTEQSLRS